MSNELVLNKDAGTAAAIFSPDGLDKLLRFAEVMAKGNVTVPSHLVGKPADCMAVAMQAAQWGMNPFAVAQKTHVVSGTLGYEAQLVNAVITTMSPTKDRINYEWFGPWEGVIGKFVEKTSQKGNKYIAPDWTLKDEKGCGVRVWATMKGEDKPRELELLLSQAQVRNSTLWASDPKQQLAYLAVKRWSRLHCPDVIMGVYTPDELAESTRPERDITPATTSASDLNNVINGVLEATQEENTALIAELTALIQDAATLEEAATAGEKVKESQSLVSKNAYEELLYAAKVKYARIDSHHCIEAAINSLDLGGEDPAGQFAAVEKELKKREQKLGAELFEAFTITLNDLRPEFQ
ncbi:MAG: RecT family recombinase [Advenella sp.]|uniref:RecT family recombinase n=1 Tax=Rahnella bonaserana TaxID=2816248 RepID=UPI0024C32102|nr:RecT family recombinase [Rahnella bonaserana]WHZ42170.1 RecT family recombinase [Rahnella bonaserana]